MLYLIITEENSMTKEEFFEMEFDKAVEADPWSALEFAGNKMTDEQFNKAIRISPHNAIKFCNSRLTWEQYKACCNEIVR